MQPTDTHRYRISGPDLETPCHLMLVDADGEPTGLEFIGGIVVELGPVRSANLERLRPDAAKHGITIERLD